MSAIRKELGKVAEITQEDGETDQKFLTRLAKAISDLADDDYNGLSKKSKDYADEVVLRFNDADQIPGFPDEKKGRDRDQPEQEGDKDMPATREAEDNNEDDRGTRRNKSSSKSKSKDRDEAPAKKQASSKSKSKDRDEEAAPARSAKTKSNGGAKTGGLGYVRELLAKDPSITVDDLADKVEKKGYAISKQTLNTTRSGFRQDVRALQEAGALKRDLIGD